MHPYQFQGVEHIKDNPNCALFLDMGLGKTVTTLTAIKYLMYEELEISKVLVIAPKRVAENVWSDEIQKWGHLNDLKILEIKGSAKKRKEILRRKADIYTLGRDNVSWICAQYGGSRVPFDMLVIDELSSFKNPRSIRFKSLRKIQPCFKRIVGLTGTPAPNGLMDLWSQIYLLDRGERLGKYITNYRSRFFTPGARNGAVIFNYKTVPAGEKEIHKLIGDICMSMKAEDYLQLPDKIENIIEIKFPPNIQKKYDDFEREQVLSLFEDQPLEDGISAVNAAALSNKLLQFANGAVYDKDKNYHVVHDLKIEALKEIVEDSQGPVLIGWTYRSDRERIHQALKKYNPRNLKDSQDIRDWNEGKIKILTMHPASGGHGLNLQAGGSEIIWFGQTWSLELLQQFNARIYRQGQDKPVIIHKLACSKTLDMDVIKAQDRKALKQDSLILAVRAKIKKYMT